ncbi:MAG TPA: dTDP-4-dehydrorhamnose reductase [Thermoleophilaceae bacterium]|nr:dTDP-4-dehydrorhamnose reductase [Thermoleophilaceae bacterium]
MRLLVLGATGMLGRDLMRRAGDDAVGLGSADADVTDPQAVRAAVDEVRPDVVVNSAAMTEVDRAEDDEQRAMQVNGEGAGNVAAAAAGSGAAVLYVSTDYVFDGAKGEPYVESDETAPLSVYGRSKLAGEVATAQANERHFVVRSSWLFGAGGANFPETMLRLASEGRSLRVVADQVGCPTYTGHLAEGLLRLMATEAFGVHHMAAAGACSRYELALETFARTGVEASVEPAPTSEHPRPAPRPPYSVLVSERDDAIRLPDWRKGLDAYLAERQVRT